MSNPIAHSGPNSWAQAQASSIALESPERAAPTANQERIESNPGKTQHDPVPHRSNADVQYAQNLVAQRFSRPEAYARHPQFGRQVVLRTDGPATQYPKPPAPNARSQAATGVSLRRGPSAIAARQQRYANAIANIEDHARPASRHTQPPGAPQQQPAPATPGQATAGRQDAPVGPEQGAESDSAAAVGEWSEAANREATAPGFRYEPGMTHYDRYLQKYAAGARVESGERPYEDKQRTKTFIRPAN